MFLAVSMTVVVVAAVVWLGARERAGRAAQIRASLQYARTGQTVRGWHPAFIWAGDDTDVVIEDAAAEAAAAEAAVRSGATGVRTGGTGVAS